MMTYLQIISQTAIRIIESPPAQAAENSAVETADAVTQTATNTFSLGDPLAITLWFVAVLLTLAVWYQLSKPTYYPRREWEVGKGPFTRLRDRLSGAYKIFL